MDRRQRKTREAIFIAFTELISKKNFNQITVGAIIEAADIGRATFYAHFETKDHLLEEFCKELFCHIFDTETNNNQGHRHIFECSESKPIFLHLLHHLQRNDHNILSLLASNNNELFLRYFRVNIENLVEKNFELFELSGNKDLPESFLKNHIAVTFVETIRWWIENGMKQSPEVINDYFFKVL